MAEIPADRRKLRACLLCSLIKAQASFKRDGCDNCEEVLRFKGTTDRMLECTSANYDGVIAMMRPDASWVARWQRVDKFTRGMYAIRVAGRLPEGIQDMLADRGIKYSARDGSARD
ncbi:Spt4/RpoE2 zinc finger-domain-containing protein [Entophlyctis helioformis]|nr:Spt4/RpoE2 zinc finger-domain-containing protein [Entophlyctis helioformis]